jgi:mycothiol synthase
VARPAPDVPAGGDEAPTYRPARPADIESAVAFLIRCDLLESGEAGTSLEDLQYEWGQLQPDRDVRLTFDRGQMVGYAAVFPWASRERYDIHVDPSWRESDVPRTLFAWCEGIPKTTRDSAAAGLGTIAYVSHVDWQGAQVLEEAGFRAERTHFNLQTQLDSNVKAPAWPAGTTVREFFPEKDDREVYELIQAAFDRTGREGQPYESWRAFMMREDILDPSLWFLAESRNELVGACLCFQYPGEGWVRQLAVGKDWRNRGIGGALLRHAFQAFWRRGFLRVGLSVASDNPRAGQFYEGLGMRCIRQYVEYVRPFTTEAESREEAT